jgi:DNA-binding transcriptional LysR family regulator
MRNATSKSATISLRQIEAFKAIVETASVTAAASAMHVSQPSVSRLLRSLEENIGFNLFERRKGRLLATPEALLFYDEIQKYFRNLQKLAHTAAISARWLAASCGLAHSSPFRLP